MASLVASKTLGLKTLSYSQACVKHSRRVLARRGCHILSSTQAIGTQNTSWQNAGCCRHKLAGVQMNLACRFKSHYEHRSALEYEDLIALIDSGDIYLVDVRDVKDINDHGAFPGALNIPLTDLKKALQMTDEEFVAKYGRDKPKKSDTNVVFASLKEVKSSAALEIAHKLGYNKSRQYANGYEEWREKQNVERVST